MSVASAQNQTRRVLVVDDNPSIHSDIRKILVGENASDSVSAAAAAFFEESSPTVERVSYEIDDAFQGPESLSYVVESVARKRPYDVAFVDMRMPPGWDGLETVERLWEVDPALHVVFCTAYSDHSWREILQRLGRNDLWLVLKKPFDTIEVEQLAAALTEKRRLLHESGCYTRRLEQQVRQQTRAIRFAHEETIHMLVAASMYRDKETGEHIRRVGMMSAAVAEAAGWKPADVDCIRMAAPMHDVGKIGIPDAILQNPSFLTCDERKEMEKHSLIGGQLLGNSESPMLQMAQDIALYHHEWWDGSGYPTGLAGKDIPQAARIVAVVDVFDALTHDRVYRPAQSTETALDALRNGSGSQFDPQIVELFIDALPAIETLLREHPDAPLPCEQLTQQ